MSPKASRGKRTKHVRNVDASDAPSSDQSIIDKRLNIIPAGRQLQRTPPSKSDRVSTSHQPNRADDPPASQQVIKDEPCAQEITKQISCNGSNEVLEHPTVKEEDRKSVRRSSSTAASATGNADPEIFIQGMQGYQWTDTDLEFVYQTKLKKQVEQLQQELSDVLKSLKAMRQLRDVALAAHDKIQTELSKVSSCERVQEMSEEILLKSQSSVQLEGLDFKGLLARLKVVDVQHATSAERTNISKLNQELSKAQTMREKQELLTKDIDICKVSIDQIKVNIDTLTAEMAALESQLLSLKEAPQSAKPRQKGGPKPPAASSTPKPSTAPKPTNGQKASIAPRPPSAPETSTAPKLTTAPKPSIAPKPPNAPSAPKPSTAPKPPTATKASIAPKPPAATKPSKASIAPKPPTATKASIAPKPPTAPKPSKPSIAPKPTTDPKVLEGDVGGLRRSKRIAAKKDK